MKATDLANVLAHVPGDSEVTCDTLTLPDGRTVDVAKTAELLHTSGGALVIVPNESTPGENPS